MVDQIVFQFYEVPVLVVALSILACVLLWAVAGSYMYDRRWWRIVNILLYTLSVLLILSITLILRDNEKSGLYLIPFSIFEQARIYPDVYNQMVLNVLLFLPLGLSLPFCLTKRVKNTVLITILFAFALSVGVEIMQFILKCGYSEVDDVILNVMGAFLGALSYVFAQAKFEFKRKGRRSVE